MRIEQHIVAAWASHLSDQVIKDTIKALEEMESEEMLSGDSGLKNVWEEICVQVQAEESVFWETYVDMIEGLLADYVKLLDGDAQLALWTATDDGWGYIYDHHADDDGVHDVPVDVQGIVAKLRDELLSAAADHESPSIYRFLWGQEDGYEDLEDDDESDYPEDEEEDVEPDEQGNSSGSFYELQPGVSDPVVFVITRQQIEAWTLEISLEFLRSLVPTQHPEHAWSYKGRLSLVISGYDTDLRELFEIPEVCRYLHAVDEQWPFWLFFLNQVDESIKVVAMCLASTIEIMPGAAHIDPARLHRFLERGFAAVNYLFDSYGFPESEKEALSKGVSQLIANSMINPDPDD